MIYEITQDCRIAGVNYKKGDIVTVDEVGQYYPSIMAPVNGSKKQVAKPVEKIDEPKVEEKPVEENLEDEKPEENLDEVKPIAKPKAKSKKK